MVSGFITLVEQNRGPWGRALARLRGKALSVAGCASCTVSAFLLSPVLGWLALGVSFWLMEWRLSQSEV